MTSQDTRPPNVGRSILAVLVGFIAVAVLSLGTDQLLHVLNVYPPWGERMDDPRLNLLALSYRCVYGVIGAYITARLAPRNPMRHVWIQAGIGLVLSILGAIGAVIVDVGPAWYPILLAVSVLPCAWLGGMLYLKGKQVA